MGFDESFQEYSRFARKAQSEAKPYSADLFVALVVTVLAVEAYERPTRIRWLVALGVVAPAAILMSYPSVFVLGGAGLALLPGTWSKAGWRGRVAWFSFASIALAAFLTSWFLVSSAQFASASQVGRILVYWEDGLPRLDDALTLPRWILSAHTGRTFAYPLGGENGASVLTFACFAIGATALYRAGRERILAILLLPFGATMAAAVLGYYPYGARLPGIEKH